jgi:hypothetical protein
MECSKPRPVRSRLRYRPISANNFLKTDLGTVIAPSDPLVSDSRRSTDKRQTNYSPGWVVFTAAQHYLLYARTKPVWTLLIQTESI